VRLLHSCTDEQQYRNSSNERTRPPYAYRVLGQDILTPSKRISIKTDRSKKEFQCQSKLVHWQVWRCGHLARHLLQPPTSRRRSVPLRLNTNIRQRAHTKYEVKPMLQKRANRTRAFYHRYLVEIQLGGPQNRHFNIKTRHYSSFHFAKYSPEPRRSKIKL